MASETSFLRPPKWSISCMLIGWYYVPHSLRIKIRRELICVLNLDPSLKKTWLQSCCVQVVQNVFGVRVIWCSEWCMRSCCLLYACTVIARRYRNEILEPHRKLFREAAGQDFILWMIMRCTMIYFRERLFVVWIVRQVVWCFIGNRRNQF